MVIDVGVTGRGVLKYTILAFFFRKPKNPQSVQVARPGFEVGLSWTGNSKVNHKTAMDIVLMLVFHYRVTLQNDVTCCWPIKMQVAIGRRKVFCDVANSLLQLRTLCRLQRIFSDKRNVKFEISMAVTIKVVLFWYRTPCNAFRKDMLPPYSHLILYRWRQHVLPKHFFLSTKLHDSWFQKWTIFKRENDGIVAYDTRAFDWMTEVKYEN
jgi:hypothetical protein